MFVPCSCPLEPGESPFSPSAPTVLALSVSLPADAGEEVQDLVLVLSTDVWSSCVETCMCACMCE